jgi:H+/Cl- antiporter ClcA
MHKGDFSLNQRLLLLSIFALFIGALSSAAAWLLLAGIRLFTNLFFYQSLSLADRSPADHHLGAWVIVVPAIGGLIVGLMCRFGSEKIRGHGIPEALEAILYGKSRLSAKVAVLKPLSSAIVIGSGGPFGAEGPIIMTGGAAASLLAQAFHLTSAERKALLVAGACAGMTAVFGTPVAAVLFAVELLLFELRPRSLLPVLLACAVAAGLRPLWLGTGVLFPLETAAPTLIELAACLAAGLACGALSAGMTAGLYRMEDFFSRLPVHWMWWPAIGGLIVGVGGFLEPRALGVGYDVIRDLLTNQLALTAVATLLAVKLVIWMVALASGTSGGVLAPLLTLGAGLGCLLGAILPGEPALWALVCMAATLGGTMRAPLTAVLFAFGLTHDVNALLPTALACAAAYGFTVVLMPRSILTEKIARRGRHVFREYGVDPLERHFIDEVMTREVVTIPAGAAIGAVLRTHFGATQSHRAYPVVGSAGELLGVVDREALNRYAATGAAFPVAALIDGHVLHHALPDETCRAVAARMAALGIERLPVVESASEPRLLGIVSRSDLVKVTRQLHEEESRRERFLLWGANAGN